MKESTINAVYYRLIALWVLCEAMLGGIIHGFRIPVSGLMVGSCAVICICLIAWYTPKKGCIIKATIIVAIFKMMLSPQAPLPAYIAVFFQGLLGELLFHKRRWYALSCVLLAVLSLLESGLQRILVLTIVYGNDLWKVINDFINGLVKQKETTNYSLWIGAVYTGLHVITGLFVGWWVSQLPAKAERWSADKSNIVQVNEHTSILQPGQKRKRRRLKKGLFVIWILLIAMYLQSCLKIGEPLLPSHISLKILLRSFIIVLGWVFLVGPLLTQLLHTWLKKKQTRSQQEVQEVLQMLPLTQSLIAECWKRSGVHKGIKRLNVFSKMVLTNCLSSFPREDMASGKVFILTAPIQSGKTTSLLQWSENRADVFGILTPLVNGKRIFLDATTKEQWPMEAAGNEEAVAVGRFLFSKKGFEKAVAVIAEGIRKEGWLVIDEIGPLELQGEGFDTVLRETIQNRKDRLLMVVREGMAEKMALHYGIRDYFIVKTTAELPQKN